MGQSRSLTRIVEFAGTGLRGDIRYVRRYILLGTVAALAALGGGNSESAMSAVLIIPGDEHPVPGNLNAHLRGDKLVLPKEIADVLRKDGVRTAEDLLSYFIAFPSSVAHTLHWSLGDVSNAAAQLRMELKGHVADDRLQPQLRPNPPLGARNPDGLP
jgi:hypothetical protein